MIFFKLLWLSKAFRYHSSPSTSLCSKGAIQLRKSLGKLDLRSLPRDEGPPSELQQRREKFQFFETKCSEVSEGIYVGGETVAKNIEILRANGITHVVNAVGFLVPNMFEPELSYLTLRLLDTTGEDLLPVLYDVFDYIDSARSSGGKVFVHCSQGVSRSAALAIAYLMWKTDRPYDEVFQMVKDRRGVVNPNIGFICQLLQWQKRRTLAKQLSGSFGGTPAPQGRPSNNGASGSGASPAPGLPGLSPANASSSPAPAAGPGPSSYILSAACREGSFSGPAGLRVYRLAPHSANDPRYPVPKVVTQPPPQCLDSRFSFVMHSFTGLLVWHGAEAPLEIRAAADRCAAHLERYEGAPPVTAVIEEGSEPAGLWAELASSGLLRTDADGSLAMDSSFDGMESPTASGAGAAGAAAAPLRNPLYDGDWDVWEGRVRPMVPSPPACVPYVPRGGMGSSPSGGLPTSRPSAAPPRWDDRDASDAVPDWMGPEGVSDPSGVYSPRFARPGASSAKDAWGGGGASMREPAPLSPAFDQPPTIRAFKKSRSEVSRAQNPME